MQSNEEDASTVRAASKKLGSALFSCRSADRLVDCWPDWRAKHLNVTLTISEINGREIAAALEERRLDVALIPEFELWPHASSCRFAVRGFRGSPG
jgi:hypothetical protein